MEEQLREMFGQIGRIDRFYLARDKNTNRLRGFAFITYEKKEHTERAINTFNNAKFGHLILKVTTQHKRVANFNERYKKIELLRANG